MDNNGAAAAVAGGILKDEIPYSPVGRQGGDLRAERHRPGLRRLLPRGQRRSGAQPRLAEDLGGHGRLRRPNSASSRPPTAAAVEAAGKDGPADKATFAAAMQPIFGSCKILPRGLPHRRTEARGAAAPRLARRAGSSPGPPSSISPPCRAACRPPSSRRCPPGDADPRRDLVLGRRLRLLPCRPEKAEGRGPAASSAAAGCSKRRFGDFVVPNISSDPSDGIGGWSAADFANAMLRGVSPDGRHFYPAFPYASFTRMRPEDIADLWAYLQTLPAVPAAPRRTTCASPTTSAAASASGSSPSSRDAPAVSIDTSDPAVARGQYLAEGPGHCGECHTPRNFAGALDDSRWLAGAPAPEGKGQRPEHHRRRRRHRRLVGRGHRLFLRDRLHPRLRLGRRLDGRGAGEPRDARRRRPRRDRRLPQGGAAAGLGELRRPRRDRRGGLA